MIICDERLSTDGFVEEATTMKICQACGHENADEMSFCLDCGKPLAAAHPPGWLGGDTTATSFGEMPTTVRRGVFETDKFQAGTTATPQQSKSSKKIFVIIGGIVSLMLLIIVAAAAVVGYKYYAASKGLTNTVPANSNSNGAGSNKNSSSPSANVAPTPAPSFTPPTEPTKTGTFTVFANGGWQLSDIDTVPLENFKTKIDGKIDIAGVKTGITSSGVNDAGSKSRRVYPEFPTGALLMRTHYADGKFSNVAAMSANRATGQWVNYQDERGKIEFCINDNSPGQNGGQFTVTVTMTSVPKPKK